MRVGLVLEQFEPRRGGLEQWTTQFATELLSRGHEVHVVAKRFSERSRAMPIIAHHLKGVRSAIGFAEAAQEKLLQLGPDVIHDMGSGWFCDLLHPHGGSLAAMARWKPLMAPRWLRPLKSKIDGLLPRYRNFRHIARRQYLEDGRLVIALSKMVADDFKRFHGIPSEQVRLVYNGVDTGRFSPERRLKYRDAVRRWLGIDDDTLLLLIVTHNFRLKGVPALMKAVKRIKGGKMPVHLAVVGGKPARNHTRAAAYMGIGSDVTFVGSVDDTAPYYAAADIYAHPTLYDSCSLVVLEALASGLPVITSSSNGAAELISEGIEGYVVPDANDVELLVERIGMLSDPAARRQMGERARELSLKHTLRHNVDQILAVYDEIVKKRARVADRSILHARVSGKKRTTDAVAADDRSGRVTRRRKVLS
jgi:UDP-glucose:(heptosyl)LPS alpha-1,3-glucosyltransferase